MKKQSTFMKVVDFIDPYVTSIAFFIIFLVAILSRYLFRAPATWTTEVAILGYIWTMFFGVGKCMRDDSHVVFALVYDKLGFKGRKFSLILYNVILIVLLAISIVPSFQACISGPMVTGVLKLPYKIVFFPYFFMVAEIIINSCVMLKQVIKGEHPALFEKDERSVEESQLEEDPAKVTKTVIEDVKGGDEK